MCGWIGDCGWLVLVYVRLVFVVFMLLWLRVCVCLFGLLCCLVC